MIDSRQKTSILIPSQIPEFIRDDEEYSKFVAFIQAYYEWMEENGGILDRTKNLLNYQDIDNTLDQFIDYFKNEFLPFFPKEYLVSDQKAIKFAREFYQNKGIPASFKFLFRILYNSDCDIFNTKDAVLRASDGIWYVDKHLRLNSNDVNFLKTVNYQLLGEESKSIATIENVIPDGSKIDVYISNIKRNFLSGENVSVIDSNNQPVLFDGKILKAKIVGQITQIKIDPKNRGTFYSTGDPVVVYGGLDLLGSNEVGATAEIGDVTKGIIKSVNVISGGEGYREHPYTNITVTPDLGTVTDVGSLSTDPNLRSNVDNIISNTITLAAPVTLGNTTYPFLVLHPTANVNTTFANAFSFISFTTYPISSIVITTTGSGSNIAPQLTAESTYDTTEGPTGKLSNLGILGPIRITNPGVGYVKNDIIKFTGGNGRGANANVTNVTSDGAIISVSYQYEENRTFPLGGFGYKNESLPLCNVVSSNVSAHGANVYVSGILGTGATFSISTDKIGSINNILVTYPGEDYVSNPSVSLKVEDIIVYGVDPNNLPKQNDMVYQGPDLLHITYSAFLDSITPTTDNILVSGVLYKLYKIRVYNYDSYPSEDLILNVYGKDITLSMAGYAYNYTYDSHGVRCYGDGTAKANATFLSGLNFSNGRYVNSQGQPSSYSILQNDVYNNYTYILTTNEQIEKYRSIVLNLVHPAGTKMLGRYSDQSQDYFKYSTQSSFYTGRSLEYYTGYAGSTASMTTDFTTKSNNIVTFTNIPNGTYLSTFIFSNNAIEITPGNGPHVKCEVISVDDANTCITLKNNTWLTFANVANIVGTSGSTLINIQNLTNSYDIINNGIYSDPVYPIKDIVYAGDEISVSNNTPKIVSSVNYGNNTISLTSDITSNVISYLSVRRILQTKNVVIWGPIGTQYIPELITENGLTLTTENGSLLILG